MSRFYHALKDPRTCTKCNSACALFGQIDEETSWFGWCTLCNDTWHNRRVEGILFSVNRDFARRSLAALTGNDTTASTALTHWLCQTQQTASTPPEYSGANVAMLPTGMVLWIRLGSWGRTHPAPCPAYTTRDFYPLENVQNNVLSMPNIWHIMDTTACSMRIYQWALDNSRLRQHPASRTCMALVQMGS